MAKEEKTKAEQSYPMDTPEENFDSEKCPILYALGLVG